MITGVAFLAGVIGGVALAITFGLIWAARSGCPWAREELGFDTKE